MRRPLSILGFAVILCASASAQASWGHSHYSIRLAPGPKCEATTAAKLRQIHPIGSWDAKKKSLRAWGNANVFERAVFKMLRRHPRSERVVVRRLARLDRGSSVKMANSVLTDLVLQGYLHKRGKRYELTTRGRFWLSRPDVAWRAGVTTTMRTFASKQPVEIRFFSAQALKPRRRGGRFVAKVAGGKSCAGTFYFGGGDW